jgi:hypothetical protein
VADRLGADAYQAVYAQGAALTFREVAPTLLAELDRLLAEATEQRVVSEHHG